MTQIRFEEDLILDTTKMNKMRNRGTVSANDSFAHWFNELSAGRRVNIVGAPNNASIYVNDRLIIRLKDSYMSELYAYNLVYAPNGFLQFCDMLEVGHFPDMRIAGDFVLAYNNRLSKLDMPKVEHIGKWALFANNSLKAVKFPELRIAGTGMLENNKVMTNISAPKIERADFGFLKNNTGLQVADVPAGFYHGKFDSLRPTAIAAAQKLEKTR